MNGEVTCAPDCGEFLRRGELSALLEFTLKDLSADAVRDAPVSGLVSGLVGDDPLVCGCSSMFIADVSTENLTKVHVPVSR